jgi:hypothetical protein
MDGLGDAEGAELAAGVRDLRGFRLGESQQRERER